ncbi:hypothetical protein EJ02DRAFT_79928 [Clathrospora elynae]|uniref:Uncharacterized protein n=1 Tax=Clathrospora elynae TaxID=706981 RepID=A0A6A5SYA4_9PLEO|nr:hypothetical protein EJ02DRAFT_79928 [Clathrospora elynae]
MRGLSKKLKLFLISIYIFLHCAYVSSLHGRSRETRRDSPCARGIPRPVERKELGPISTPVTAHGSDAVF